MGQKRSTWRGEHAYIIFEMMKTLKPQLVNQPTRIFSEKMEKKRLTLNFYIHKSGILESICACNVADVGSGVAHLRWLKD